MGLARMPLYAESGLIFPQPNQGSSVCEPSVSPPESDMKLIRVSSSVTSAVDTSRAPIQRIAGMFLPFAPLVLGSQLVIAVADGVPTIDIQKTCKAAAVVTAGPSAQTHIHM